MARNFFAAEHAPYYIAAMDYIQQSAGIRVLHYLCHALNESGLEAYVSCEVTNPQLRTPALDGVVLQKHHLAGRKPIVVYPEIMSGDPLAAGGVVVRWLLNRPGHVGGDTVFPATDLIFFFDPAYLPSGMQGTSLRIPTVDLSVFNNDDNPYDETRDLTCFYAHKYLANGGLLTKHVEHAVSLCKDQKLSPAEIAAILRRSRVLYVYEPTAMITEALLCGCPTSIIVTDYWRGNMAGCAYPPSCGIAMDDKPESLVLAREGARNFRAVYEKEAIAGGWRDVNQFVEITQKAAGKLAGK